MIKMFKSFLFEESGQGMAEYGLILALVACAVLVALGAIGTNLTTKFNFVAGEVAK